MLSLEQNLIEDTGKVKKKVCREKHQINRKRQYGSNCIVL